MPKVPERERLEHIVEQVTATYGFMGELRDLAEYILSTFDQQPLSSEFKGSDGKWYQFDSEQHRKNTIEAGFEVRNLYGLPGAIPVIKMPQRMSADNSLAMEPDRDGGSYDRDEMLFAVRDAGCVPEEKGV